MNSLGKLSSITLNPMISEGKWLIHGTKPYEFTSKIVTNAELLVVDQTGYTAVSRCWKDGSERQTGGLKMPRGSERQTCRPFSI